MSVSQEEALDSLNLIHDTATRTRRALAASYAANLLILWGLVWVVAFTTVHFVPDSAGAIWGVLDGLGLVGTVLICWKWPIRSARGAQGLSPTARRMIVLWLVLLAYAVVSIRLLRPATGMLLGTFLVITAMLGYVVIGLWSGSSFMVWLGLAVTGLTLVGCYLLPGYFNLWMAPTGGGALLGTGLYLRMRWSAS